MKFKLPEDLKALSDAELASLITEALAESKELLEVEDSLITDEQLSDIEALADATDAIESEQASRASAAADKATRLAAARGKLTAADSADEDADESTEEDDEKIVVPDDASELVDEEEKELVTASAKRSAARQAASQATAVVIPPAEKNYTLVAAANVAEFEAGQELDDFDQMVSAFQNRSRNFKNLGGGNGGPERFERFGVGKIRKAKNEFSVDLMDQDATYRTIMDAAKEARLPGNSLVAAGGWCAPSETVYDFCSLETVTGLISVPEVDVRRGGIRYTKGPDYSTLAADWGFLQTEAQAEAGTVKVCYDIECPAFDEVRLDVIGFCVKNGILTNVGYPELTRRILEIGAAAHAHKLNAQTISRISTLIGAATAFTGIGGSTADVLDAISLQAVVLRYQYALDPSATLEVVAPLWLKEIVRSDLSRRNGVDLLAVTDAQIQGYFSVRNIAIQWVYDYQPIATTGATVGQAWPTTVEVLIYPAGAYVRGRTDVIDLDTVYDSTGLSTNTYTAAFFEEGFLVVNTCGSGRKVTIDISCLAGVTGAAELTCVTP
jgi:hypothetical protein